MDFSALENNLPGDWDAEGRFHGNVSAYHMERARKAIASLREINPAFAQLVSDAILHSILAARADDRRVQKDRDFDSGSRR